MHQASNSIGAIAAALAKAQAEISNPEKSLTAMLGPGEGSRTFRYAPLSSGLDIIRKSLGRYEIAVVQTTAIDQEAALLRLTTVLAHSSGEWISSEWPICPISESNAPHRLGAALTYARRYALFSLVGIAGEDDTDAPDLPTLNGNRSEVQGSSPRTDAVAHPPKPAGTRKRPAFELARQILAPEASVDLRDELEKKLTALGSAEELTAWAGRALPRKNALRAADAAAIEQAFEAKATSLNLADAEPSVGNAGHPDGQPQPEKPRPENGVYGAAGPPSLAIPKTQRRRDKGHLRFVATQPCLVCGRLPSDAHHVRFSEPRALGCKVSDEFTVPLCRAHHQWLHRVGDEQGWWKDIGIDPLPIAQQLWAETRNARLQAGEM